MKLPIRVLTTSARKPPFRTYKFAALWRIAAPVHPIRRSNCAESGYCKLIRPRKGLTSNPKRVNGPKRRGENGKSTISASKRADLNGGFRADVVSTRRRASPVSRNSISSTMSEAFFRGAKELKVGSGSSKAGWSALQTHFVIGHRTQLFVGRTLFWLQLSQTVLSTSTGIPGRRAAISSTMIRFAHASTSAASLRSASRITSSCAVPTINTPEGSSRKRRLKAETKAACDPIRVVMISAQLALVPNVG